MAEDRLDAELRDLGAAWRAENPADFRPAPISAPRPARGRGWLAGLAAAAVVAAFVGGTVALLSDDDRPASPAGTPATPPVSCEPPTDGFVGEPAVPAGAVAVRLCGRIPSDGRRFDSAWPGDVLTGAAAAAVAARLNALPARAGGAPEAGDCQAASPAYDVVLQYPDGSRVLVHAGRSADCEQVSVVGGGGYVGAASVREAVLASIEQLRAERGPLGPPVPSLCPQRWASLAGIRDAAPVTPTTPVAVTACAYRLQDTVANRAAGSNAVGRLEEQREVPDPGALIAAALDGTREDPCAGRAQELAVVQRVLVIRDDYGEIHVVSGDPCWAHLLSGVPTYPSVGFGTLLEELTRD